MTEIKYFLNKCYFKLQCYVSLNYFCIMSGCRSPLDGTIICLAVFNVGRNAKNEVVSLLIAPCLMTDIELTKKKY